jgi:hypothetical protein
MPSRGLYDLYLPSLLSPANVYIYAYIYIYIHIYIYIYVYIYIYICIKQIHTYMPSRGQYDLCPPPLLSPSTNICYIHCCFHLLCCMVKVIYTYVYVYTYIVHIYGIYMCILLIRYAQSRAI